MSDRAATDLASLALLARDGTLDLTRVAFRVKTDLVVSSGAPTPQDLSAYVDFALAVVPMLAPRDLGIVIAKLAQWPHTPPALREALIARDAGAEAAFALAAAPGPLPAASADPYALPGAEQPLEASDEEAPLALREDIAQAADALNRGDAAPAQALLMRPELTGAELAPLFTAASPKRQAFILEGLARHERLRTQHLPPRLDEEMIEGLIASTESDAAGAFQALATRMNGTPAFAALMQADASRKLAGLAFIAGDASVENAVRFAIKLGDDSSRSVAVIFGLVDLLRLANPVTAYAVLRAVAGGEITVPAARAARHLPVADPSATPQRGGRATGRRLSAAEEAARLLKRG